MLLYLLAVLLIESEALLVCPATGGLQPIPTYSPLPPKKSNVGNKDQYSATAIALQNGFNASLQESGLIKTPIVYQDQIKIPSFQQQWRL